MTIARRIGFPWPALLLALLLALAAGVTSAAEIRNVAARQQADRLVVSYDLEDPDPVDPKVCAEATRPELCREMIGTSVAAMVAVNGQLYSHESLRLEGDVGRKVAPGKGRSFSWQILRDFPQGLSGDVQVNVTVNPVRLRESDVASLSDQQTEIFRRMEAEQVRAADSPPSFGNGIRPLAARIDQLIQSDYAQEPDPEHLARSRYYCARFPGDNVAKEELAGQWEKRKRNPPPVTEANQEKYFNCLLGSLDAHSGYLGPDAYQDLMVSTKGEFAGLGMEVTLKNGILTVVSPIEDTPAFRAGILAGDRILEIDGKATKGVQLMDSVKLMRGQKGTRVLLTIQREGRATPLRVELVRDVIVVRSVRSRSLGDGYGYIRIAQFQEKTVEDFDRALASLRADGALKGLVLDLRNDPGGLLNAAIGVASRFIDSGLIVSTQGRQGSANRQYPSQSALREPAYPIVVLINGGSASASEIVTGALQDHRRAIVVGSRSFGKGSVQTILPLERGALKLTTALYYTPSGKSIQQIGIVPDIALDEDAPLAEGSIVFARRLLREAAETPDIASRRDVVDRLRAEEFAALYKNAVRTHIAVGGGPAELAKAAAAPAAEEQRVALVIGNGAYPSAPLKNPVNDARAIAARFKALGFEVIVRENVRQKEMTRAITQFGERLARGGAVGIFYYAGHGMQVRGKNYLIPVDAQISSEASVRSEAVDADSLLEQMEATALGIVILDACRNNPFERRFRSVGGGLAQMDAPKGTLIAYATAPGKVASDGDGRNGLYTQEFLKVLDEPGLKVEDVFKRVRRRVADATGDQQVPWESSSLTGDFYFVRSAPAASAGRGADVELMYWQSIRDSRDPADFVAYLKKFPDGQFADIARNRLKKLGVR